MKTKLNLKRTGQICLLTGLFLFGSSANHPVTGESGGQLMSATSSVGPPLILLTGRFHPNEETSVPTLRKIEVRVEDTERTFEIEDVENLTGTETRAQLLEYLFGKQLFLRGPDQVLQPLQKEEMVGKSICLKGLFDEGSRTLKVESVKEGGACPE
jgi:hypothetical protein